MTTQSTSEPSENNQPAKGPSVFAGRSVFFFMNWLRDGAGMINREIGFAEELAERGAKVSVASHFRPSNHLKNPDIPVDTVVPTRYLDLFYQHALTKPWVGLRIKKILAKHRPEIVFVDLPAEAYWALKFRKKFGYKIVFTYHGVADSSFYAGDEAKALDDQRAWCHKLLRDVDQVIVVSDFLLAETEKAGVEAKRLHNGFDTDRCSPERRIKNLLIAGPLVLFVGRYTEYKGAFNIVKAFAQAVKNVPDAELVMHGYKERSGYMKEITDFIAAEGITDKVHLFGPIDGGEMMYRVNASTIFANGSLDETFCMPLLEAEACGKACVAFAAGGIPEVVIHGKSGLLAPPGDIEAYAEHLVTLLSDDAVRAEFETNALAHAENFTYPVLCDQLESITGHLLA